MRPIIGPAVTIAIGGASCSGKTSTASRLKQLMSGNVLTYPAYTTRPKRPKEEEGLEYFFKTDDDLAAARRNPRFGGFTEARGFWYWSDANEQLRGVLDYPDSVHLFLISQPEAFLRKKMLFPNLKWIWIEVSDEALKQRLLKNPDRDFESSLQYNAKLRAQDRTRFIDLVVTNEHGCPNEVAGKIRDFVNVLIQQRFSSEE